MADRIELLSNLLKEQPHDAFMHHALALEYLKINNPQKAEESFRFNLEYNPDYIGTYYHLGRLFQSSDLAKAKEIYQKGIALATEQKDFHSLAELRNALAEITLMSEDD